MNEFEAAHEEISKPVDVAIPHQAPKYSCGNCLYAWGIENTPAAMCRRFPPTIHQSELDISRESDGRVVNSRQTLAQFPIVMRANWCGEHKKAKPEPRG
jgi:hypothetical protein